MLAVFFRVFVHLLLSSVGSLALIGWFVGYLLATSRLVGGLDACYMLQVDKALQLAEKIGQAERQA